MAPRSRVPSGKFFVSVLVEDENQVPAAVPESFARAVGADLGLHGFLVLSTGEKYAHPQLAGAGPAPSQDAAAPPHEDDEGVQASRPAVPPEGTAP